MATVSAVMIVKNESGVIEDALRSVDWADEIVVLDSGSDDGTPEIARRYTDKVFVETDWQGFGIQRQRAQEYASGDWIFMIDADERVSPELREEITKAVAADDRSRVYEIAILPFCFGRFLRHGGWYPAYKKRLYPKNMAYYNDERVHEKLQLKDGVTLQQLKGDLLHYTYRDLEHYLMKSATYASEWGRQFEEAGRRTTLLEGMLHAVGCFFRIYVSCRGFLDGKQGFLIAVLSAHSTFVKYADLWVRNQRQR
jgi:(heptosyl)LPS beta-1,4-glucosyltransferase